ncbi:MAG TPA: GWxTD domain-containing protein [Thermoanaerobaculia bacterium]|nr:GWxTD domain-containing protein [Thermoanaerobaculia bacterium]
MLRRSVPLALALLTLAAAAPAATLPSLFYKAKEQFRLADYAGSLKTLDALEAEASRPGNEAARAQLAPSLAFYRGVCYAALGNHDEALTNLETYLAYQPSASLDPSLYPKRVITALEEARKAVREQKAAPGDAQPQAPVDTGSFAAAYRAFKPDRTQQQDGADEAWADGPVRYLLTAQQRADYERLSDLASRSTFVVEFWKAHDPTPETPENEFRDEFEKRVAFADARLAQDETRGSLTDRGMLFVLLGPPTWVGRKPLAIGDDTADPNGMSRHSSFEANAALKGAGSGSQVAAILASMSGPANTLPESETSWREVWHYRRELLPKSVSYQQVDFEFVSKRGYGRNVLQRDDQALTTLEAAKSADRAVGSVDPSKK